MENKPLIRAFIVDDDLGATALLRRQLADYSVEIVGTAQDADKTARQHIIDLEPDLLFSGGVSHNPGMRKALEESTKHIEK